MSVISQFFDVYPVWATLACYVIGMFAIGYPMGFWSLCIWKNSDGAWRTIASFLLFPLMTLFKDIGKSQFWESNKNAMIQKMNISHETFATDSSYNLEKRAGYIFFTMMIWPLRLCWLPVHYVMAVFFVLTACVLFIWDLGRRGLLVCRKFVPF